MPGCLIALNIPDLPFKGGTDIEAWVDKRERAIENEMLDIDSQFNISGTIPVVRCAIIPDSISFQPPGAVHMGCVLLTRLQVPPAAQPINPFSPKIRYLCELCDDQLASK